MKQDIEHHPALQRLRRELHHEGFETALEHKQEDDYVTLIIQRHQRYY